VGLHQTYVSSVERGETSLRFRAWLTEEASELALV
jgi:hypothetical protein